MIDIEKELERYFKEYSSEIKDRVNEKTVQVAKKAADNLKKHRSTYRIRSGDYNKSWMVTQNSNALGNRTAVIHNKKHYRLTHLLENGHVKRNGKGRTREFKHIAPEEERAVLEFEKEVMGVVGQ